MGHGRAHGVLTQLAFRSLMNGPGIWPLWVNAITHAACLGNGCLPAAGPASTRPFFALLLFSLAPSSVCSLKGSGCILSRSRRATRPRSRQLRPQGPAWLLILAASVQRSMKVDATSFFSLTCCKCAEIKGLSSNVEALKTCWFISVAPKRGKKSQNRLSCCSELVCWILTRVSLAEISSDLPAKHGQCPGPERC